MCTTRHGTTYIASKSFQEITTAGYEEIGTPGAVFGLTMAMEQSRYKSNDFRCMTKDGDYYEMDDYLDAYTQEHKRLTLSCYRPQDIVSIEQDPI